jgi:hypothetical protein
MLLGYAVTGPAADAPLSKTPCVQVCPKPTAFLAEGRGDMGASVGFPKIETFWSCDFASRAGIARRVGRAVPDTSPSAALA